MRKMKLDLKVPVLLLETVGHLSVQTIVSISG